MDITWYGQSCFKIEDKETSILIDPYDPSLGLKLPKKLEANILFITHDHYDHNYKQGILGNPYTIECPGEYEVAGATITGIPAYHDKKEGKERGGITIYTIEFEDLTICHLGDLGHDLSDSDIDKLGTVDILMIPVGGGPTINGEEAAKIVGEIEPKIVIPMHYRLPGLKINLDSLDKFTEKMKGKAEEMDRLKIKVGNLPQETRVVVLKPQSR